VILTYRYRIKDNSAKKTLRRHAFACNQVWNYCAAYQRDIEARYRAGAPKRKWPSHFDLQKLTKGTSKEGDYPEFYFWATYALSWLGQAGVLSCVIALIAWSQICPAIAGVKYLCCMSESGRASDSESIVICNFPENKRTNYFASWRDVKILPVHYSNAILWENSTITADRQRPIDRFIWEGRRIYKSRATFYFVSGCSSKIIYSDNNRSDNSSAHGIDQHVATFNPNISSQLPLSSFVGSFYEPSSRPPESYGGAKKEERESRQERVGDFEPVSIERRPELGTLFAAMLCIALAFGACRRGMDRWDDGFRLRGATWLGGGLALAFDGIFGPLLGFDLWSLGRLL
jgi:hypothetical protein